MGSQLYFLNQQSSTLAETATPSQTSLLGVAATGPLTSSAYDATNNLLLGVDDADNIPVLNAATLAPAGHLFIPNLGYLYPAYVAAGGGAGFVTLGAQVLRFDPVSLQATGAVTLLNNSADNLISYSQPVISESTLYVPLSTSQNGARSDLPAAAALPQQAYPSALR